MKRYILTLTILIITGIALLSKQQPSAGKQGDLQVLKKRPHTELSSNRPGGPSFLSPLRLIYLNNLMEKGDQAANEQKLFPELDFYNRSISLLSVAQKLQAHYFT